MRQVNNNRRIVHSWLSALIVIFSASVTAQESYSPYVGQNYPTTVYWGDTHLHTSLSVDAYTFGNRIGPAEAYRFAGGEAVTASNGMRVQLRRPLDFLVLADHDYYLGVMSGLEARDPVLLATDAGRRMLHRFEEIPTPTDPKKVEIHEFIPFLVRERPDVNEAFTRSVWNQVTDAADRHNDPGRFTAFIGFEWTSGVGGGESLHRVVIFRDGAEKANQVMPFSALKDSPDPEALWAYMAEYEKQIGGEVLAIPHNGNLSSGAMFPLQNFAGQALTRSYAERRSRWEPLYEVTQIKGDSEAHPFLSPTDEFADYETWSMWGGYWGGRELPAGRSWNEAERILEGEYARPALKRGLGLQVELGVNPFKFGMIGSTDAHTSLSAVDENNFWGKAPLTNPGPDRPTADKLHILMPLSVLRSLARKLNSPVTLNRAWQMASSGYAAVWATENTREALFAAMKRKETYATTGPRMTVRFFGGWDYSPEDALRPDLVLIGYRKGVPMGGDLTNAPAGKAPRFLIRAVKDPDGAHLDRMQVIKGWRDAEGELHERIYNVALSDGRKEGQDSRAVPVGSTVDVKSATYTNTIGAPELATVWTDPDFDPKELAFYYVRVLEIPTPRWTAYDAKFFGIKAIPPEVPTVTQERAYTSPIWYTP